tara:strand:+ start:3955 stop:4869 length:915 start_codon:yes stop_codon:yes gene_type:complete
MIEIGHTIQCMPPASSTQVSPKQFAQAIGVSESSIKRWADEGRFPMIRTAGGHRRIAIEDAIRFVREAQMDIVEPDAIGLTELEPVRAGSHIDRGERIRDLLVRGESEEYRAALLSAYLGGESLDRLCDGPIRSAMVKVGELWLESDRGIFEEHRTTALAVTGMIQLGLLLGSQADRPLALGGAIRNDHSQLATLMASFVLKDTGFRTLNLGANTPANSFHHAIDTHEPGLVWVSANHVEDGEQTLVEVESIISHAQAKNVPVVLGGRGVPLFIGQVPSGLETVQSMGELAAFGKGILRGYGVK